MPAVDFTFMAEPWMRLCHVAQSYKPQAMSFRVSKNSKDHQLGIYV